jgi:septal ring factor EnvC (AmiA/AmiB activator)
MLEVRPPMSESEFTPKSQPLVLRVEISAEQATALAPLLGSGLPALPASAPAAAPVPDEVVDERLRELELREAEFEADVQLREDRMERWRTELEELEQTLERRERDLVSYVDQLQGAMASPGGNDAWWQRPAGGDGGVY